MSVTKVFLSGGFRSNWQKQVIDKCGSDIMFFNPRDHGLDNSELYTTWDIHFVKNCDILFAYMEESNPSGYGLAFELGLAYSLNKTIILIDEKSKTDPTFERYFEIIRNSSNCVFDSLNEGINFLQTFNTSLKSVSPYDKY